MIFTPPFDKARAKVENAFSSTRTALEQARTVGERAAMATGTSPPSGSFLLRRSSSSASASDQASSPPKQ
ncbi:hypothetical protein AAVH_19378 [Aphelenchoides avenae]|nr:hypothetical protein AAVH_19378 [Aphelenchus avenae]